jgi:peptidoglycan-N-acetylglucosamine deacetylase
LATSRPARPVEISLTVLACLVLTASAAQPVQSPEPPVSVGAAPGPGSAAPGLPGTAPGTAPQPITGGTTEIVDMSVRGAGALPTVASWQYISGAQAFNHRLDERLLGILDAHAGGRHEPAAREGAAPASIPALPAPVGDGVSVTHEVVLAVDRTVGSKLVQVVMSGGVRTGYTETIWYEYLTTGLVLGGASLIDPGEIGTLREMLRDMPVLDSPTAQEHDPAPKLTAEPVPAPSPEPPQGTAPIPDAELLAAVAFTPAGHVTVTLSRDPDTGTALADPVTVTLSAKATGKILSTEGLALRRHAINRAPFKAQPGADHVNCDLVPCAALTYDDGPNAQTTRLLQVLEKHDVKATFFMQGNYVTSYPHIARSVADAGHTVANHTMSHTYLTKLPAAGITREVQGAQAAIENAAGVLPAYLRPPYGATSASVAAAVGLPQILWDVDSQDWQSRDKAVFIPRIMTLVKPGSVILQHDVHAVTVDGQDELITQLKNKGYYLVTLPQLFAGIDLKPGGTYKCRGTTPGCTPGR